MKLSLLKAIAAGALLAVASIQAVSAGGGSPNPPSSPFPSPSPLGPLINPRGLNGTAVSLVTFNLRFDTTSDGVNRWSNRRDMVYRVVRSYAPDFMGIQEGLRNQIDDLERNVGLAWVGVGRDDGGRRGEHSAIFYNPSRWQVINQETFWMCDNPTEVGCRAWGANVPRICTFATFRSVIDGRLVRVFNVHLDNASSESRQKSVDLVLSRIPSPDSVHTFFMGDFNAGQGSEAFNTIACSPSQWVDTYRQAFPTPNGQELTFHGFNGGSAGGKIDVIWARKTEAWSVVSASIDRYSENGRYPSDHYPVTAVINLPATR